VLVIVAGAPAGRTQRPRGGARQQPAAGWADLAPDLNQQPEDHTVTKRTWGAFHGTGLERRRQSLGVTQVVITGVATSIGVESTSRQAHEHGFNVTLAVDAMTNASPDAHTNSVTRIFPRLRETGTAREIIDLLDKNPT
jgi:nicotinamidase-related amidase